MFLSTNSLSIVYTFSWEYISISSHIVVCPLFNITSVHKPERNNFHDDNFRKCERTKPKIIQEIFSHQDGGKYIFKTIWIIEQSSIFI